MNTNYGLYLYAPSSLFPKIKSYITSRYHTVTVQGVSEFEFFERDFLTNPSSRNLSGIVIVSTQRCSSLLLDQYNAMVLQINSLQALLNKKLKVTILYVDNKVLPAFNPLRKYVDLSIVHISAEGLKNDVIDKIIIAPMLKDSPRYMEDTPTPKVKPDVQYTNPVIPPHKEPVNINVTKQIDVDKQFESNNSFTATLRNIHDDLKNMELRMDVTDWTHQELESALESLGNTGSFNAIDTLINSKAEAHSKALDEKMSRTEKELENYQKLFEKTKDEMVGDQVSNLVTYRDGLNDVKEICEIQNKTTLYKALQNELIAKSNKSIESFQSSLQEIEDLKEIKDIKQRIEQMKAKRTVLIKDAQTFKVNTMRQYNAIEAEVNAQEKLLITQATTRKENYEGLQEMYLENSNEKLKNQLILDREIIITITKEIKSIQESKKQFVMQFNQIMKNYEKIISLDSTIQNEYEVLTSKLAGSKRVVVEAKDNLGTKLEVFIGNDGAGKTCVAVNYAQAMIRTGKTVCVIDLDLLTPELQYYTESYNIQDIIDFLGMECSADGLSNMKLEGDSCYIVNNYYDSTLLNRVDNYDTLEDIQKDVLSKLSILAHVFDKIILITRAEISEFTNELYSRCGKWYYITDLNPTNLSITEELIKALKEVDNTTYYKVILNKFVQTELSAIAQRLNINTVFNPIKIQFSHALTLSKLDGTVASATNNGLLQTFNFK